VIATGVAGSASEAMRITSGGNVGIGNDSPGVKLEVSNGSDSDLVMMIRGADDTTEYMALGVNGSNGVLTAGASGSESTNMVFRTASSGTEAEAMRIDSSGNLLVGVDTNTTTTSAEGLVYNNGGSLLVTRDQAPAAYLTRTTSDGDIAVFRKGSSTVGSIGTALGSAYLSGNGAGAIYINGSTDVRPWDSSTQGNYDNQIDLGASNARFKDLHTSGRGFFNLYSAGIADGNIMVSEGVYVGAANGNNQIRSSSAGAGSATLYIGNAAIQVSSDQRLKTNIVDTEMNATEKLNQVRVVDFNWDDPSDTSFNNRNARGKWTGVLAQELVDVLPFAVNAPRNEEDLTIDSESDQKWLVDQAQMVPVLIKAIQELTARIAALEGAN